MYLNSNLIKFTVSATYQNTWSSTHIVKYDNSFRPVLVIIRWNGDSTIGVFCIFAERVVEIVKNGNGTYTTSINTNNREVTFNLNNTGILTCINCNN